MLPDTAETGNVTIAREGRRLGRLVQPGVEEVIEVPAGQPFREGDESSLDRSPDTGPHGETPR
jgi:hypothetical protein